MLPSQAWFRSPVTVFHFSLLSQPSFAIYQHPELRIICSEATIWRGTNYSYIQVKNVVPNYSPSGSPPRWRILFAPALAGLCIIFKFFFLHPWVLVSFQIKSQRASCYQTFSQAVSANSSCWHALQHYVSAPGSKEASSESSSSQL